MTTDEAVDLFNHMEWADSVIWNAVQATDAARTDRTVLERLHHVHVVQRIYLQMWLGRPDRGRELASFGGLSEVQEWARDYYQTLRAFAAACDPQTLASPVEFPWAEELVTWFGEARPATIQETLVQVAMHTSHHRGQLCSMIRELGGEPPLVDFIAWIWMGRPGAAWQPLVPS